ncbi:MAG: HAD family hydrolase [Pseudodesulfovibrio sp.]|nr:HAD family hydrolase [Pseudodesulfovibrio sp.]
MSFIELPINYDKIQAVLFDIDGTIYSQKRLRRRLVVSLGWSLIIGKLSLKELSIISLFRRNRERHIGSIGVHEVQKMEFHKVAEELGVTEEVVCDCIRYWMFEYPLPIIRQYRFSNILEFLELLERRGVKVGFFSDYPVRDKLQALGMANMVGLCSTSPGVDSLKPDPKGLIALCRQLEVDPKECLYIGDRVELDGECAKRAGMPYLIIGGKRGINTSFSSYEQLVRVFSQNM